MSAELIWDEEERAALFVRALRVDARVGIHLHERGGTQVLLVDLEIDIPMPREDKIAATVDYVMVADLVQRVATSRHFDLIETFARQIGRELMAIAGVRSLLVRITKPSALAGAADSTGVEIFIAAQ